MLLEIILVLASIPVGFLVAYLARDELVSGRKWFLSLMILAFVGGMGFYFYGSTPGLLTCAFVFIFTAISLIKSYDRKWTGSYSERQK